MIDVLWISLTGAGLVFLGLIGLWLLMDLLVRATSTKKKGKEVSRGDAGNFEKKDDLQIKQKAAAASVAVSIALLNTSFLSSRLDNTQKMSSWQIVHRNQQIHNRVESKFRNRYNK